MSSRPAFERLRVELTRRGLPRHRIERFLGELSDHLSDLKEEKDMSMEVSERQGLHTPLGTVEELADSAVANYRRRTLVGRHPVLAFLVAPIPMTVVGWTAFFFLGLGVIHLCPYVLGSAYQLSGKTVDQWPSAAVWAVIGFHHATRFLPPALVAVLFCYLAYRGGLRWRWAMLASGLVAVAAGTFTASLHLPTEVGEGAYRVSIPGAANVLSHMLSMPQLPQLALPLMVSFACLWFWHGRDTASAS